MKCIPGPMPRSKPWHALRKYDADRKERPVVFGATDAAACCGMSPYRTPLDVFCEKQGLVPELEDNDAMRMGRRLEPIILDEYQERTGIELTRDHPMYFHESIVWMGATPDGLAINDKTLVPQHGVDAKATTYRRLDKEGIDPLKFGEEETDQLPVDYLLQGQQQCEVLGLPFVEFPVLFDARTLRIYRVERNDDLIQGIIKAEQEMYQRLVNNDPPEPNWSHENTRSLIGAVFGHDAEKSIEASQEMRDWWATAQDAKDRIKTLDEHVKVATNKILFLMGDAARATFPQGTKELRRIAMKAVTFTVEKKAHVQLRECKAGK